MGVCDVPGVSQVCDSAAAAADSALSASARWLATALGDTAAWLIGQMWSALATSTRVDVTSPAYVEVYHLLFGIAVCLMLMLFFAQLCSGLLRRDPTALATATIGLGKAVVGSFLVLGMTGILLEVTDQLAAGIVSAAGTSFEEMGGRLATLVTGLAAVSAASPTVGVLVAIAGSGLLVVGAVLLWSSLLIRKAVLLVMIVLAPIALSGWVWSATRDWVRRWAAVVVALIVSKLVVVVVLLVATAQLSVPLSADLAPIGEVLSGIVLLFLAAFAPYMAYRFISFVGIDASGAAAAEQDTKRAAVPHPASANPTTIMSLLRHRSPAGVISASGGAGGPAAGLGAGAGAGGAAKLFGAAAGAARGSTGPAGAAGAAAGGVVASTAGTAIAAAGRVTTAAASQQAAATPPAGRTPSRSSSPGPTAAAGHQAAATPAIGRSASSSSGPPGAAGVAGPLDGPVAPPLLGGSGDGGAGGAG